ncbi:MAG: sugar ABC transporter substrate-binding protein [Mycobacteriales bacterium]
MRSRPFTPLQKAMTGTALVALAVSGCGRKSDDAKTDVKGVKAEKGAAVKDGPATGEITVWALGAEGEKLGEIARDFEKANPGVKVNVTVIPFDAAHDKIATAIAGKQAPDISQVGTTWLPEFAATGALDATPELIKADKFFSGSWGTTEVGGTSYGVPWYTETRLIYYRKDLAEKAGVTPAAGWKQADLKAFAKAMQDKGGAKWGISLQPGGKGSWQSVMPFAWQNGAELVADKKFTMNTAPMQAAVDYYGSFFAEKISPTDLAQGAQEAGFINGSIGAFVSGPWHMGILEEQGGAGFAEKWALAPMPKEKAGTSFTGGSDLVVFKDSKNRDAAWKFVDFLTQDAQQQKLYDLVGSLPAVQGAWKAGKLSTDPLLKAFGDQLQDAKSAPAVATWEEVAAPLDAAIEQVALGKSKADAALKAAEDKANAIGPGK